ncbi:MAG: hypothetical protein AAF830_10850 [Pseudomonadota bacterium]
MRIKTRDGVLVLSSLWRPVAIGYMVGSIVIAVPILFVASLAQFMVLRRFGLYMIEEYLWSMFVSVLMLIVHGAVIGLLVWLGLYIYSRRFKLFVDEANIAATFE